MKRLLHTLLLAVIISSCQVDKVNEPQYIIQVSLGSWNSPDYTAEQIIGRIDTVSSMIPVAKVIIGWSLDKEIYCEVGDYLHSKNIKMLLMNCGIFGKTIYL